MLFKATGTKNANTVHELALRTHVERWYEIVNKDLFDRLIMYKTTMATISIMKQKGLISKKEISIIEPIIAKKYGLNSSVIYRKIT